MSLRLESANVLVPAARIDEGYPGGLDAYAGSAPDGRFRTDGELTCVGFDSRFEAQGHALELEKLGLRFEAPHWSDIAVIDRDGGGTETVPWIGLVEDDVGGFIEASLVEVDLPDPPEPWEE